MRCTSPRTVGFQSDGKTLAWSQKNYSKEFATFQLPCGKCLSCRLETARQTAVRCIHEASMYQNNSFVTLTYSDNYLKSEKLIYKDFQDFVKRLRNYIFQENLNKMFPNLSQKQQRSLWNQLPKDRRKELYELIKIGIFVAGEYGDKGKRPHWHALIFNWRPTDETFKYSNFRGDKVFSSKILDDLWSNGITEFGDITFESAGYCARYATKKLVHGRDGEHDFNPISKRSSKQGIGRAWIEKYYEDAFNYGYIVLPTGQQCGIPRYYEKWFQKNHPEKWRRYVTETKLKITKEAIKKEERISKEEKLANLRRSAMDGFVISRNQVRKKILELKTKLIKEQKC